jgi:protein-S-isoprenylcysteine O-methyltransferase Ste14
VVFLVTFGGALWAGRDLGETESLGLEGDLRTGGWHRYSRNPQYVCHLAATVAFVVVSGSALVLLMGLVSAPRWLVSPLAEEPWLREQYGAAYEEYTATVPRFLGLESLRRLIDDMSGSGRSNSD